MADQIVWYEVTARVEYAAQYRGLVGFSKYGEDQEAALRASGFEVVLEFSNGYSDGFHPDEVKRLDNS